MEDRGKLHPRPSRRVAAPLLATAARWPMELPWCSWPGGTVGLFAGIFTFFFGGFNHHWEGGRWKGKIWGEIREIIGKWWRMVSTWGGVPVKMWGTLGSVPQKRSGNDGFSIYLGSWLAYSRGEFSPLVTGYWGYSYLVCSVRFYPNSWCSQLWLYPFITLTFNNLWLVQLSPKGIIVPATSWLLYISLKMRS